MGRQIMRAPRSRQGCMSPNVMGFASNQVRKTRNEFRNLPWFDYGGQFAPLKAAVFTSLFIPAIWTAVSYAMDRLGARR